MPSNSRLAVEVRGATDAPEQEKSGGNADNVHCLKAVFPLKAEGLYTDSLPRLYSGTEWYGVGIAGRVLELKTGLDSVRPQKGGGCRGQVGDFSRASSRRLLRMTSMVEWDLLGSKVLVTLTYPESFPTDGREAKRHLKNFRARWWRKWGRPVTEVWKMEFQYRGAPHFHLLIPFTGDVRALKAWASNAWYEVCGRISDAHLMAGTNVKFVHSDCSGYLADMNAKKGHQNETPVFFVNPGRYWGVCGERPHMRGVILSEAEYHTLRRVVVAWKRATSHPRRCGVVVPEPRILKVRKPNGRRVNRKFPPLGGRAGGRLTGRWYVCPGSSRDALVRLARVLGRPVVPLII